MFSLRTISLNGRRPQIQLMACGIFYEAQGLKHTFPEHIVNQSSDMSLDTHTYGFQPTLAWKL